MLRRSLSEQRAASLEVLLRLHQGGSIWLGNGIFEWQFRSAEENLEGEVSLSLNVSSVVGAQMLGRWQTGKLGCVSIRSVTAA